MVALWARNAVMALLFSRILATDCIDGAGSCKLGQEGNDEMSLVQVQRSVRQGGHREKPPVMIIPHFQDFGSTGGMPWGAPVGPWGLPHPVPQVIIPMSMPPPIARAPVPLIPTPQQVPQSQQVVQIIDPAAAAGIPVAAPPPPITPLPAAPAAVPPPAAPTGVPLPSVPAAAPTEAPAAPAAPAALATPVAPEASAAPAVPAAAPLSPLVATDAVARAGVSPQKAAKEAAANRELADKAMANAAEKAVAEESAASDAAEKASALSAAAQRAAVAENAAADSETRAADAAERQAVAQAAADRAEAVSAKQHADVQKVAAEQAKKAQKDAEALAASASAVYTAREAAKARSKDKRGHHKDKHHNQHGAGDESGDHHHHKESTNVTCLTFQCLSPLVLRLQPELLKCSGGGCTSENCCLAGPVVTASTPPRPAMFSCNVGDAVEAVWAGDKMKHRAVVAKIEGDMSQDSSKVTVTWADGDPTMPEVKPGEVFKNGQPCFTPAGSAPPPAAIPVATQLPTGFPVA